jgi:hypothetical protein
VRQLRESSHEEIARLALNLVDKMKKVRRQLCNLSG